MDEGLLDIAEVAERSGLAPSALRFYEKKGLITPAGRNGLRRTYHPDVLERLALITCARGAGFSVAEVSRFVVARPSDADLRVRMTTKADDLDEQIGRLSRLRDSLRHAAVCDHEPIVDCPDFKRAVGNVPQVAAPQATTPRTTAPQATAPPAAAPRATTPQAAEPQAAGRQTAGRQAAGRQTTGRQR
ncbi:MerR family transcriptional regulator [Streptomyces sp. NPDC101160]|uniref:MerR family transcriptional regulator n=1 Tax=Streptomyces sp. NPDC101160 TaxID=3366118 RepID=UPI003800044A